MGGNAVPGVGAIHISELYPTLMDVQHTIMWGDALSGRLLGSAGKQEYSGDIDIVLGKLSPIVRADVHKKLLAKYGGTSIKVNGSLISVAVPISQYDQSHNGRQPRTGKVQVDLIFNDEQFTRFFNFSPGAASRYKGVHRNLAIAALSAITDREISDDRDSQGRPLETIRWKFGVQGLVKVKRYSVANQSGGHNKTQRDMELGAPITCPEMITRTLLGDGGVVGDMDSIESIISACIREFNGDKCSKIFDRLAKNIVEYNSRSNKTSLIAYGVPPELEPFMMTYFCPDGK